MSKKSRLTKRLRLIGECISAFTKEPIPKYLLLEIDSDEIFDVQDWVSDHLKKEFKWQTAIGIIEAASHMYQTAKDNGNFNRKTINRKAQKDAAQIASLLAGSRSF